MERYNHHRQQKQEKVNQAQYQIIMDRLKSNEKSNNTCETERSATNEQKPAKRRKIVVI
ncbi:hypothetical protein [Paraflavitalea speifideaquila]|uniref:hypothetical protein n=1 Tax=Paraflavitalea speifideaquila TaxID=3076558 RepID=UPI0028ED93FB|nr:hypothetical protein [Paraflavitalea speifideiaquila]